MTTPIFAYRYELMGKISGSTKCKYIIWDDDNQQPGGEGPLCLGSCEDDCSSGKFTTKKGGYTVMNINPSSNLGKWILKNDKKTNLKKVKVYNQLDYKIDLNKVKPIMNF